MATYYVKTGGSDAADGLSPETAWETLAKVNGFTFAAGDVIRFHGGDTFAGTLTVPLSGSIGNAVVFRSYGTGLAIIDGGANAAVVLEDKEYVELNGLQLESDVPEPDGTGGPRSAVALAATTTDGTRLLGVKVRNCVVSGGQVGINAVGPSTDSDGFDGLEITDNEIRDSTEFGIYLQEDGSTDNFSHFDNPYVARNNVHDITGDSRAGTASGCGIVVGNATFEALPRSSGDIEDNDVHDCGQSATQGDAGPAGIFPIYSTNCVVQNNVVARIGTTTIDGAGIDLDLGCDGCVVRNNYVYDCDGSGLLNFGAINSTFCFNLLVNNTRLRDSHVRLEGADGCLVFNNTVACNIAPIASKGLTAAGSTGGIYNNTFAVWGNAVEAPASGWEAAGNNYILGVSGFSVKWGDDTYTTLADFRTGTGQETGTGFNVQSRFANPVADGVELTPAIAAFSLEPTSGLLGEGLDLNDLFDIVLPTTDLAGNTLPANGYSVGCLNPAGAAIATAYLRSALNSEPYQFWRLNEAEGAVTAINSIIHAGVVKNGTNTAITAGAESLLTSDPASTSYSFNGTTSGIATAAGLRLVPGRISVEMWIKPAALGGYPVAAWGSSVGDQAFLVSVAEEILFAVRNSGGELYVIGETVGAGLEAGATYHIVAALTGATTAAIYVNGVAQTISYSQQNTISVLPDIEATKIGRDIDGHYFEGLISNVALYAHALSAAEVLSQYEAGSTEAPTGNVLLGAGFFA